AISRDGTQVLSGDRRGGLLLWDLTNGRMLRWLDGHEGKVTSAAFAPNGRYAVSGGTDGTTRLWELQSGKDFQLFEARWDYPVTSGSFSPDGKSILAAGGGGRIRTWSVKTGEPLVKFKGATGTIEDAVFSAEGLQIVACTTASF